jgi:predicted permease
MSVFNIWHNVRIACRSLIRQRSFSLMSIGILAIGIAGMATVFSLFNGLYLRPFPVPNPDRLMDLNETAPKWGLDYTGIAFPDFHAWREHNKSFESMYAWTLWGANLSIDGKAERANVLVATHDYFDVLGIQPVLGRRFTQEEDRPNGPSVALLSYGLWKRMSGRNPAVLGQTLRLDGNACTIIGVLPPEAGFPADIDLLRPLAADPLQGKDSWYLSAIGRMRKGVTVEQARDDLTRIHRSLAEGHPANQITSPTVSTLRQRYLGEYWQGITILLGAVALVLLIACCNVASIMLARGSHRGREIATRLALGATGGRIIRHILTESILLSAIGGIIGILLADVALTLITTQFRELMSIPSWMTFDMDIRCTLFCLSIIGIATVLSGLIPGLHAARTKDFHGVLQSSGIRNAASGSGRKTLSAIVVGQVALALILLICAGLVLRAFQKVQEIDPGFRPSGIVTYQISLPSVAYPDEARRTFFEQHLGRMRALPGVTGAGLINVLPMSGLHEGKSFDVEGAPVKGPGEQDPMVLFYAATPGYFETMGIKLLSGRFFDEPDNRPDSERTVIVNESFARHFWPGQNAIDRRMRFWGSEDWMRVVGVTGDVKHYGLERPVRSSVYVPYSHVPCTTMFGIIRTGGDPVSLVPRIREIVRSADSDLPVHDIKTMSGRMRALMLFRLTYSSMFLVYGSIAAIMAFAGIYGVISYWAGQRTQEIGIRMALGARAADVVKMVIREGLWLVGAGMGIGLVAALGLSRLLTGTLYQVSPTDLTTFVTTMFVLVAAAGVACYIPARRAAKVDPMVALRYE